MEKLADNRCFEGRQTVWRHDSAVCGCPMTFAVYLPPQAEAGPVPALWYLSGLTCTHENAMVKGGFQAHAARAGLAVIFPDTSPRGEGVADDEGFDLGQGAGFYVDATQAPWSSHYRMASYVTDELRGLVGANFPLNGRTGVTGHSMGGHGAITLALKAPALFDSLSAFAPIANPAASDWGRRQFTAYLGADEAGWAEHDASHLMATRGWKGDILIDQGSADPFLDKLKPAALDEAMAARGQSGTLRMQAGYDHSYFFVSTFAGDHVDFHAERLGAARG